MPPVKKVHTSEKKPKKSSTATSDSTATTTTTKKRKADAVAAGQAYYQKLLAKKQQRVGTTSSSSKKPGNNNDASIRKKGPSPSRNVKSTKTTTTPKRQSRKTTTTTKEAERNIEDVETSEEEDEEEVEEPTTPSSSNTSPNEAHRPSKRRRIVEPIPTVTTIPTYPQQQKQQQLSVPLSAHRTTTTATTNRMPPTSPNNASSTTTTKSPTIGMMMTKPPFGSPMPESRFLRNNNRTRGSPVDAAAAATTATNTTYSSSHRKHTPSSSSSQPPSSMMQQPKYSAARFTNNNKPIPATTATTAAAAAAVHWEDSQVVRDTLDYNYDDDNQEQQEVGEEWILFSSKPSSSSKRVGGGPTTNHRIHGCLWTLLAILWIVASAMVGMKLAPPESLEFLHFAIPSSLDETTAAEAAASSATSTTASTIPCYVNSQTENNDPNVDSLLCPNPELADRTIRPCPEYAICVNGTLESCIGMHHVLNPERTACVLSPESQAMVPIIQQGLEQLSANELCHPRHRRSTTTTNNRPMMHMESGRPMFPLEQVIQQSKIVMMNADDNQLLNGLDDSPQSLWNLLQWINQKESDGDDQRFILEESIDPEGTSTTILLRNIGLHPSQPIPIPIMCRAKKMLIWTLSTILALVGTVSAIILTWIWQWFWDAPKEFLVTCTIGAITFRALYYVRSKRRAQRQLELDVLRMRQRVYQELSRTANSHNNNNSSADSSAVLANMILNRIVWEWFPLNRAERQRWSFRVWPLVVRDIESDDRVHKSFTDSGGNTPQLVWQWLDHPVVPSVAPETNTTSTTAAEPNTRAAAVASSGQWKNGNHDNRIRQNQQQRSLSHQQNHRYTWSGK
jgi:hypothetical protein